MSLPCLLLSLALPTGMASLPAQDAPAPWTLESPDGCLRVGVLLDETGRPGFAVSSRDEAVVAGSLGLEFLAAPPLGAGMKVVGVTRTERDETYAIAVGKASSARDHHREMVVALEEVDAPHRRLDAVFRAFDDGVAFRCVLPEQAALTDFTLTGERTALRFPGRPAVWALALKDYTTPYEAYYRRSAGVPDDPQALTGLPMLMNFPRMSGGTWLAVTEAGLTDYAGMYLAAGDAPGAMVSKLSPLPGRDDGAKVVGRTPFATPWRVLMVADGPGRLIESDIVFHLNAPSAIDDPSWIRPGKTTFPWWNHYVLEGVDYEPGVNTATMRHYIDFCAEHGIPYHSLDGLDVAWYGGPIQPDGPTDVTTAAPSIDMPELLRHAKEKGVRLRLWMHWKALAPQLDEAFATYERWGIEGVMIDFMDRDDQEMVSWYHEVARKAADHHLTVTWHGAYKPTGMERTWPNVLSYEAVLNQEYNKWRGPGNLGTPPEHNVNAALIRMLAGPLDYHQGGMRNVLPKDYEFRDVAPPVQGTRGHQLAMYVVYRNHLPMLADFPSAYRGQPGLDFLVEVPCTWDETRVLHAEMGACVVVARRKGDIWWLGGMTAAGRTLELPLDFLGAGAGAYDARIWTDDPGAGPTALSIQTRTLTAADTFHVRMPPSGGFAARLTPSSQ